MPTITRLGAVWPGTTLRFEAGFGRATPDGHSVANVAAVGLVAVTLSTTAVASFGTPDSVTSRATAGGHGVPNPPVPMRESRMRYGACGEKRAPLAPPPEPSP